jgi:hypothetical protein
VMGQTKGASRYSCETRWFPQGNDRPGRIGFLRRKRANFRT